MNRVDFSDSQDSRPSSPTQSRDLWSRAVSFKDKVVGEILGAYTKLLTSET